MTYTITVICGDGIGQEVIPAARDVLAALDLPLHFQYADAGFATFESTGDALPSATLSLCEASDAILFGATQSPMTTIEGYRSPILEFRRHFDLFANFRPVSSPTLDLLIIRENTEGLYSRRERTQDQGRTAIAERVITEAASRRIVEIACREALKRPRRKLTIVHKANVLMQTCGLFRRVALEVCSAYPDLEIDECLVDSAAMHLVQDASRFDVIVTTNLFGDILSDLAAGLAGGLGIAPSANIGASRPAVFEPVHGSAPDIAGKGIADPRAAILSAAMLLDYLGYHSEADNVRISAFSTPHTGDTRATTESIIRRLHHEHRSPA